MPVRGRELLHRKNAGLRAGELASTAAARTFAHEKGLASRSPAVTTGPRYRLGAGCRERARRSAGGQVAEQCAARVINLAKDQKHEGNDGQLRFANEASDAILTLFHCH
jgi:hypothetical protein